MLFADKNANGIVETPSEITQENQYYPFGLNYEGPWMMNDAAARDNKYQYNGKEWNDDWGLKWNDYGARWYDAAIGRWGAVDALADEPEQIDKSPLAYAWNNPVGLTDPDGNCPFCLVLLKAFATGFAIGAGADVASQVVTNKVQGNDAFQDFNVYSTITSGVAGGLTGGALAGGGVFVKAAAPVVVSAAESATKQYVNDGEVTAGQIASDVILDKIGGNIKVFDKAQIKPMERRLDTATRVAKGGPTKARIEKQKNAQSEVNKAKNTNTSAGEFSGNLLQNASDGVRKEPNPRAQQKRDMMAAKHEVRDNTRAQQAVLKY